MRIGARLRLALKIVFGQNVELVHFQDGHSAVIAEETLQSIREERERRGAGFATWQVEPHMLVYVPYWFEASETTGALAVVAQGIRQTVAVIRWDH